MSRWPAVSHTRRSAPCPATIENFNVVETLSENAVIVYQTHKVSRRTVTPVLRAGLAHGRQTLEAVSSVPGLTANGCVSESMARLPERCPLPISYEEDPGNQ